jgi:hypothetical protein
MNKVIQLGVLLHLFLLFENAAYGIDGKRGNDGQDTDKAARVLLLGGYAADGSKAGSGGFYSSWVSVGVLLLLSASLLQLNLIK